MKGFQLLFSPLVAHYDAFDMAFISLCFSTTATVRSAFVCFAVGGAIREGSNGARVHEEGVGMSRGKTEGRLRFDPWSQFEAFC